MRHAARQLPAWLIYDVGQIMEFVPTIDFVSPTRREGTRIASEVGLVDAPDLSRSEYWLVEIAYRKAHTFLIFDCEQIRDYGVDVRFGIEGRKAWSVHTFLRLYDSPAAYALGRGLPKDQADMDELIRLYANAILAHRNAIFEDTEATISAMERDCLERNLANQPFRPTGRFCRT